MALNNIIITFIINKTNKYYNNYFLKVSNVIQYDNHYYLWGILVSKCNINKILFMHYIPICSLIISNIL